ncbi:MAG: GNAT family N-acetyltransferase [Chloroflexi bacterium]|nr:MAG: GNAT family N-acetyltransferase [Chloroflexota bacterium]
MKAGDIILRPAKIDDAVFAADLLTAVFPDDPVDPVQQEHSWRNPDSNAKNERFVGELAGKPVAFAQQRHVVWDQMPKRYGSLTAELLPSHRTPERLDALFAAMEDRSRDDGTRTFTFWTWAHDQPRIDVVAKRGYDEVRRQRFWQLDLGPNRSKIETMATQSRSQMRASGIQVLTLDKDNDPAKFTKLWKMSDEAIHDIPTTVPHTDTPFDDFMKWMRSPGVHEDRVWIAREGDAILGVSLLNYPPKRGVVATDWTGVARAGRGRGIARALKCETVMQAIALGVDKVRTDNDSQNAPILHINESMGYRLRAEMIQFMRSA